MARRNTLLLSLAGLLAMANTGTPYLINRTIYNTDASHALYEPKDGFCTEWASSWIFWQTCTSRVKPWIMERYIAGDQFATFHRSIDHQVSSLTIDFEGVAVWLYAPPQAKRFHRIPDYKICVHDDIKFGSTSLCYRVNANASLSESTEGPAPAVFFTQGNLWPGKHRVVISMADPMDNIQAYNGIFFSHAVYSAIRPTAWPKKEDAWRYREVAMYDTHPGLSYSPLATSACSGDRCQIGSRHYSAENGNTESWRPLSLQPGLAYSQVTAKFIGGAVAIYGAPWSQMTSPMRLGNTCVRINSGPCEVIDAFHAYLSSNRDNEPVVLWRHETLNPSHMTELSIQLMPTEDRNAVFPFKEIRYLERREYASPHQSVGWSEDVHVPHGNPAVVYHGRRCTRYYYGTCREWFDPWVLKESGPSGSAVTYRSTMALYRTTEDPYIEFEFQGSRVSVYGAPKSFVKLPLAPQQICLNTVCHLIDVERVYMNAPDGTPVGAVQGSWSSRSDTKIPHSENQTVSTTSIGVTPLSEAYPKLDPVLLWSTDGLDDLTQHTLRLALAPLQSAKDAEMTIVKIVYTKVNYRSGQSRPDMPAPEADSSYPGPVHPPFSSDWLEPSHEPSPPTPTPSDPPTNLMNHFLQLCILMLGLYIVGPHIYRAARSRLKVPELQSLRGGNNQYVYTRP